MTKIYPTILFSLLFLLAQSQSSSLVISQVYGGGGNTSALYTNDFIEVFNKGTVAVDINGYAVQYASNTGTTWTVTTLKNASFFLQPGQYFLVQLASGGAVGGALPAPDVSNITLNISAANGKIALTNNNTALNPSSGCPFAASVIDFVGFGTANCSEGTQAPAGSNTTAILRKLNGCQDTQDNSSDFTNPAPLARNTSTAFNPCSATCTVPSLNASGLRMASSTASSLSMLFTRGNGTGAIVLCKSGSAVNAAPVSGTAYTANANFTSGSQIGTGNYVIHSTSLGGIIGCNVSGLTNGTKYFFSIFEYNDPGKCYTSTGYVDSFTVGATIFKPGDLVFIGWDADAASPGQDKYYLMNTVDISPGTIFQLVNSRFEAGAAANIRTNRWFGGGDDPNQDPGVWTFEYKGAGIVKGSVISFLTGLSNATNFTVNGNPVSNSIFNPVLLSGVGNLISVPPDGDQLYITQGKFKSFGSPGIDRYNLLDGLVIHGFTSAVAWIPLSSAVSGVNGSGNVRQSRIPPDILCVNTEFAGTNHYANYNRLSGPGNSGSKAIMLGRLKNVANWVSGAGVPGVDDVNTGDPSFISSTYTITTSPADGNWNGSVSGDWFDCSNWEGLHVPDSTSAVIINPVPAAANNCVISSGSLNAVQFSNIARADSVTILPNAILSLTGAGSEKINLENSLNINSAGRVSFENSANATTDTLFIHGSLRDAQASNNYASVNGIQPGLGTIKTEDTRYASNPASFEKPTGFTNRLQNLVMNNSRDVNIRSSVEINNTLNLQTGYLTVTAPDGKLLMKQGSSLSSAVNVYGLTNKGYQKSFVNGKMFAEATGSGVNIAFPIGKLTATDTIFAPVSLTKTNTNTCIYDAEYFAAPYADLTVDPGHLHHVSMVEHWIISNSIANGDANITLSWRPKSLVGNGVAAASLSLDSLMVSHYFNDGSSTKWRVDGGSNIIMPKTAGSNLNYGMLTTISATGLFSPFTLGTRGDYNMLPLQLLNFTALPKQFQINLSWATKEEKNLLYYEVEHSADAGGFTLLQRQPAANSFAPIDYYLTDYKPFSGWNYYRLKITELNGKQSYAAIIKVWMGPAKELKIFPNPAQKEINIILPDSRSISTIAVVNSIGQVIRQVSTSEKLLSLNIESLNKGVYFIKILNSKEVIVQSFCKQ